MKKKRLLHYSVIVFNIFLMFSVLFFPSLQAFGQEKQVYHLISSSGMISYPIHSDPPASDPPASDPPASDPPASDYTLWSTDSYWRKKIPLDAAIHPNSAEMVNWLITKDGHNNGHPFINNKLWTAPVYEVFEETATVDVYDYVHNLHFDVPLPAGATPDSAADHQLVVIDWHQRKTWDFWNLEYTDGEWLAGAGYEWSLDGTGVSPNSQWTVGGASIPVTAGIIRDEEIEAGVISHPLICALHTPKAHSKVYPPAATADGQTYDTWAIPEGTRIQLNPNIDLDSLGLTNTAKIIAKAMQDYGIVVKESGGSFGIFAEHTITANWNEEIGMILYSIPADWRIIDYSVFGATEQYWWFP